MSDTPRCISCRADLVFKYGNGNFIAYYCPTKFCPRRGLLTALGYDDIEGDTCEKEEALQTINRTGSSAKFSKS